MTDDTATRGWRLGRRGGRGPESPQVPTGPDPVRFIVPAERPVLAPLARFRVHAADRVLVAPGEPVAAGQPVLEQHRETVVVEVSSRGPLVELRPGDEIDPASLPPGTLGRTGPKPGERARLLYVGADDLARVAVGRSVQVLASPVDGEVEEVAAGQLSIRTAGVGLGGRIGWGQPVSGRLMLGVPSPDAELRASAIDIAAAGSILVAGARLDIEALTRARAIGVAGIICGGLVGRELRQLEESDTRQRAALHVTAPFAVVALDGYGRRIMPTIAWDLLVAAAGRPAGLFPESRLVVIGGEPGDLDLSDHEPGVVRITSGEGTGRLARLVGLAGPVRRSGGMYLPSGFIEETGPDGSPRRRIVPLSDLERLG
ncbi:MAG: hypothetical protein U0869_16130 [Chloroflexota bacterium]